MIEITPTDKELTVIFVNYRSIFYLSKALRSLRKDPFFRQNSQIIVVNQDDAEQKALSVLSKQLGFQLIGKVNHGFASGANAGASSAEGRFLLFLNPDIQYSLGSLRDGVDALRKNERLGIVGATLLQKNIPEPWSKGRSLTFLRLLSNNIFSGVSHKADDEVDWVSGGALFIKKELFCSLGGFDERFFLYFEDMDLCKRVKEAGFSVESIGSLRFSHQGGKSFSSKQVQKKHYFDSQLKYLKKHRPFWEYRVVSMIQSLKIC